MSYSLETSELCAVLGRACITVISKMTCASGTLEESRISAPLAIAVCIAVKCENLGSCGSESEQT